LAKPTPEGVASGPQGDAVGDAMQPARYRGRPPDGFGLARQDEESRLKGVLRIVMVKDMAADTPHQPPVALNQGSEGRLVVLGGEAPQQLFVAQVGAARARDEAVEGLEDGFELCGSHAKDS